MGFKLKHNIFCFFADSFPSCFEYGMDYGYSSFYSYPNKANPKECQFLCGTTPKCKYFRFEVDIELKSHKCKLVDAKTEVSAENSLVVFGPKQCKGI